MNGDSGGAVQGSQQSFIACSLKCQCRFRALDAARLRLTLAETDKQLDVARCGRIYLDVIAIVTAPT